MSSSTDICRPRIRISSSIEHFFRIRNEAFSQSCTLNTRKSMTKKETVESRYCAYGCLFSFIVNKEKKRCNPSFEDDDDEKNEVADTCILFVLTIRLFIQNKFLFLFCLGFRFLSWSGWSCWSCFLC